jgi:hypothetical protein
MWGLVVYEYVDLLVSYNARVSSFGWNQFTRIQMSLSVNGIYLIDKVTILMIFRYYILLMNTRSAFTSQRKS